MARHHEKLTLAWLLRHPLVATVILFALTLLLPYTRVAERLKLLPFLPLARAADGIPELPEDASEGARMERELRFERERVAALSAENAALKGALSAAYALAEVEADFAETPLPPAVPARVMLAGDASNWRQCIWINRGTAHGIARGMPVVTGRTLVGVVYMAGESASCVELLTDPSFAASCMIMDGAQPVARGVLRGDGSARPHFPRLELEDVPMGRNVRPGMRVVSGDLGGQFPPGLHVGVVQEVIPQSGHVQVRVQSDLDLAALGGVQVLLHRRPDLEEQVLKLRGVK